MTRATMRSASTRVGWLREEIELFGHDPRVRGRRMDEMLEIIRRFWREGVAEYHGEFFDFGPTGMFPLPSPVPLTVASMTTGPAGFSAPVVMSRACRR